MNTRAIAHFTAVGCIAVWLQGCTHEEAVKFNVCPSPPVPNSTAELNYAFNEDTALAAAPVKLLSWEESWEKARTLLSKMEPCEKYYLMQGVGWDVKGHEGYYQGNTPPISRLGIPSLNMHDATNGFRTTKKEMVGTVTCGPSMLSLAATWDPSLVGKWAEVLGEEFVGKGANVILGPSIEVHRVALNGRNFEYLSGEDPHLGAILTEAYVRGVQSKGVMAVLKHWLLNHQEVDRSSYSSSVDEKAKWEIYLKPFMAGIKAGAGAVMCGYNKIDGVSSCSNSKELNDVLKTQLGFRGFVQTDWWASRADDGVTAAAGLDQEMPGVSPFWDKAAGNEFNPGKLSSMEPSSVDTAVTRILAAMYHVSLFNSTRCSPPFCNDHLVKDVTSEAHTALAREAATESIVLLKNTRNVLPLSDPGIKTIAIIGSPAIGKPFNPTLTGADQNVAGAKWNTGDYYSGGGSGHVTPAASQVVTPFDGIRKRAAAQNITVINATSDDLEQALDAASKADVTIIVAGATSGEGEDRTDLKLDNGADELIAQVAPRSKSTVVLLQVPGAIVMPWKNSSKVDAIAGMFLGGQETGNAWASVLFGDTAPAGRLPIMMPDTQADAVAPFPKIQPQGFWEKVTSAAKCFVGMDCPKHGHYTEGMSTSYRNRKLQAAFPFGHGLTYTTFDYGTPASKRCKADGQTGICITLSIRNSGLVSAKAVPQLYLDFPDDADHPAPLLKGFKKTGLLKPGEQVEVTFQLTDDEASYYDSSKKDWVTAAAATAHIGESSSDIRQSLSLELLPASSGASQLKQLPVNVERARLSLLSRGQTQISASR